MIKKCKFIFVLLLFIFCLTSSAEAFGSLSDIDVAILIEGQQTCKITEKEIAVQVDVKFYDSSLINDSLSLSYHIYGTNSQLLLFEGKRIPLNAFNKNVVEGVPVLIDLNEIDLLANQEQISVTFDMIDEKNLYWFSQNKNIRFSTASIFYDGSLSGRTKKVIGEIVSHPLLLISNVFLYVAFIYGVIRCKRSNK